MSEGREFQIVGAATDKLLEPKHVRTRGTDNRLVSDERNVCVLLPFGVFNKYLSMCVVRSNDWWKWSRVREPNSRSARSRMWCVAGRCGRVRRSQT